MHVYVVYAHPSHESFTAKVFKTFLKGLFEAGHTVEVGDLYAMDFKADMDIKQYQREMGADPEAPVPWDVEREQRKLDKAQGLALIYPVWWADCPAKLKGWFDRVFTHGYAYYHGQPSGKKINLHIDRAIAICPAGQTMQQLEQSGAAQSMKRIMLNDRLSPARFRHATMEILAGMSGDNGTNEKINLARAYELGRTFAQPADITCREGVK